MSSLNHTKFIDIKWPLWNLQMHEAIVTRNGCAQIMLRLFLMYCAETTLVWEQVLKVLYQPAVGGELKKKY